MALSGGRPRARLGAYGATHAAFDERNELAALALASPPIGNTAQRSFTGRTQSSSTDSTAPGSQLGT